MQTSYVLPLPAPAAAGRAATAAKPAVPAPGNEPDQAAPNWLWLLFLLGTAAFSFAGPTCAWQ
ncbi:MAG: hypothetical protein NVS3B25_26350 [Hymenobacter sp.]